MRLEKTKVEKSLVDRMEKLNERESTIINSEIDQNWLKENVDSIVKDDNFYFIDMGEWISQKKIMIKVESFKVLLEVLKSLSFLDGLDYDSLSKEEYVLESFEKFNIDMDLLNEIENYLSAEEVEEYM